MSLIPLLFWQLPASLGEEIREAQKRSEQFLPSSLAPPGFSLLTASQHVASCCLLLSCSGATATVSVATKWGRSRPLQCITRVQTARRAMCKLYAPNNFASPLGDGDGDGDGYVCLSRTRHLSAPGKASKPFPRISIRNGFTRPTADINVNSPPFTKRPSSEEILTENLCDLPFSFRGPATRRLPPAVPWRPTRVRR